MSGEVAGYYAERDIDHCQFGDVYLDVPFVHAAMARTEEAIAGRRLRPDLAAASHVAIPVPRTGLGIVCTYTCGFLAQPPGTQGYAHPYRLVSPVVLVRDLLAAGLTPDQVRGICRTGGAHGLLYLPWPLADEIEDEWTGHAAAQLYRPTLVTRTVLDSLLRIQRLSDFGQRRLASRLIQVVSPELLDPADLSSPDLTDGWVTHGC
jgi:hypothetical protein